MREVECQRIERALPDGVRIGVTGGGTFLVGYIIAFILYMVITLYGVNVLRSIVTEKSNKYPRSPSGASATPTVL